VPGAERLLASSPRYLGVPVITIDFGGLYADIERHAQRLRRQAIEATEQAARRLEVTARERARQIPEWASLADDIRVWSQDGMLVIGMAHNDRVSQAMLLEYGDETRPPSPLFRSLGADMRFAHQQEGEPD
jgi:hypothetical protein